MPEEISPELDEQLKRFVTEKGYDPADPNLHVWFNSGKIPEVSARYMAREIASVLRGLAFSTRLDDKLVIVLISPNTVGMIGVKPEILRNFYGMLDHQIGQHT